MMSSEKQEGGPAQESAEDKKIGTARREAAGVSADFAGREKWALDRIDKEPAVDDHLQSIDAQTKALEQTTEELRQMVMDRKDKSEDVEDKVAMEKLLDKARYGLHHAFSQPSTPEQIEALQRSLEQGVDDYRRGHVNVAERQLQVLKGEVKDLDTLYQRSNTGDKEAQRMLKELGFDRVSHDEMQRLLRADRVRKDLPLDELAALQDEVRMTFDRLKTLEPQVDAMLKKKTLPPDQKDAKLKDYSQRYGKFNTVKEDLKHILDKLRK